MKSTHKSGTKWSEQQMLAFVGMWIEGKDIEDIANHFNVSRHAINTLATRMRREGVPLPRRKAGHVAKRRNTPWTQEEVEYLVRRRGDRATAETIAEELGRSFLAVQAMIAKLRAEGVAVRMLGNGVRRLWCPEKLKVAMAGRELPSEAKQ